MRVGVICEGHTDRAVIVNVLKGIKSLDSSDIIAIRPIADYDETDLANIPKDQFSTWSEVKRECEEREKIRNFLNIEGQENVVVHFDSCESDDFGVGKPTKDDNYATNLRASVVAKMDEWLQGEFVDEIIHAVAVEEIEAWVLTIYEKKDSSNSASPKEKLQRVLGQKDITYNHDYNGFLKISKAFTKLKNFKKEKYRSYNDSLNEFCTEVEEKIKIS
ncbi:hypothetical protein [Labilibaculum euxinus]|uniref:DUF4276 family protein n=1 Tax=Labilibaculum euxinus TaxID=2686357 RepID=A0A7M4D611_9BACT|nr:hypothetical protein [Labilibaculum euxinus]MUP38090.1 hypothetical protein [Labilibaculum euxinus]MVB07295.1 hypothetical protein [Labilibaculum euxinus]